MIISRASYGEDHPLYARLCALLSIPVLPMDGNKVLDPDLIERLLYLKNQHIGPNGLLIDPVDETLFKVGREVRP